METWDSATMLGSPTGREMSEPLVLVVDDDSEIRSYIRTILTYHGVQVLEAIDGADALDAFHAWSDRIHLVVSDIRMPRMTGIDLAAAVGSVSPSLPFIFVSGDPTSMDRHGLKNRFLFLEKPFAPKAMWDAARQFLAQIPAPAAQGTGSSV
jgi:DNA-binding NtrC family response regulator